jgi:hypothetical protein
MDMIQETNSQRAQITITIISNGFQTSLAIYPISVAPKSKHTPTTPDVPSASSCSSSYTTTTTTTSSCCKSQFPKVSCKNFRHTCSHAHPQQTLT